MCAAAGGGIVKLAGNVGGGGGVVDEHRAGLQAMERALLACGDLAEVLIVANAAEHEIRVLRRLPGGWRQLPAIFRNPRPSLAKRAIIDGEIVPALGADMPGHGIAHDAQADKCNFAHLAPPPARAQF